MSICRTTKSSAEAAFEMSLSVVTRNVFPRASQTPICTPTAQSDDDDDDDDYDEHESDESGSITRDCDTFRHDSHCKGRMQTNGKGASSRYPLKL